MSHGPFGGGEAPAHPLDELWYLQGEAESQGPYKGYAIKEMIESGAVGPASLVAKVGATQWSTVADVPAFAAYVPTRRRAVRYAGFWIRVLACVIDAVLIYVVIGVLAVIAAVMLGGVGAGRPPEETATTAGWVFILISLAITLFYYIYFPSGRWQATPGKRICGIHIIRTSGKRVTRALALGRLLAYYISAVPLYVGFLIVAFTDEKKGLHDMVCDTRVVYGRL